MNRKLIVILAGLFLCAGLGGAAVTVLRKPAPAAAAVPAPKKYKMLPLDDFIVNLADSGEQHYLKATVVLEIEDLPEIEAEITRLTPKVRDAMISAMSRSHFRDLLTLDGKGRLKASLKSAVNKVVKAEAVNDVYFTSFAMQ